MKKTESPRKEAMRKRGLDRVPRILREDVDHHWREFQSAALEEGIAAQFHPDFMDVLYRVWAGSDFVSQACVQHPHMLDDLLHSGDLLRDYHPDEYRRKFGLEKIAEEDHLMSFLRAFRRREMVRIAWRDLAGWASLEETLRDLSQLADACVDGALGHLHRWMCREWGTPRDAGGRPQQLVVLGMGKLGAHELNFSSDIDLIYAFAEHGQTKKRNGIENEEFFTRLGQRLFNVLNDVTYEGFVYRVDLRLRPFGESGPLVMSFDAMEDYYTSQGREWERYAMIKARVIAGDRVAGQELMRMLQPFVYRRYLDYGAFESLREMKQMIAQQVARKGMEDNIKLGPGGIREIEFIGQAFQLIRGGRDPDFRVRGIVPVLGTLAAKKTVPDTVVQSLLKSYAFLRRVENRLQAVEDRQVHRLPGSEKERERLAFSMGYTEVEVFERELATMRQEVQKQFNQVIAAPPAEPAAGGAGAGLSGLWLAGAGGEDALKLLTKAGYTDPEQAMNLLRAFREGHAYRNSSANGMARINRIVPLILETAGKTREPGECLLRMITFLEAIAGRTAYLSLLVENPRVLDQLVQLFAASPWIAEFLTLHPVLLDELLDIRRLYEPLDEDALREEMQRMLAPVDEQDLEQLMEALRYFQQSNMLHVAAADIAEAMPLMIVSDHLTEIAEVVLEQVLRIAWNDLVRKHGVPVTGTKKSSHVAGFAIIAYGKLGGIELGYGSDLDLVFIHEGSGDQHRTDGPRPVDNAVFFARLGQRIIHMLNTQTPSGVLYEVDMRLRPNGASGLLVSSLAAFDEYQNRDAWTWEHQALVRARPVAGDKKLAGQFNEIRAQVLRKQRDPAQLQKEVREMRERMRAELGSHETGYFDLKQDPGGIADIEFISQFAVLRWAHDYPDLVTWTDNIRILEDLARFGLLPEKHAQLLCDAYRAFRSRIHRLKLQEVSAVVPEDEFAEYRKQVQAIWKRLLEG